MKMVVHKIRHKLHKFHRMRKHKEEDLSPWKQKWHDFNEEKLGWLEKIVDKAIPWLVLLLLFLILGEFSHQLNFFHWHWMDAVAEFFHHHEHEVHLIDQIIIAFFVIDLYFNFFKKASVWSFLKTSVLDIIAVAPLGLVFKVGGLGEAQSILHVTEDIGKEASRALREGEAASKVVREAGELVKMEKVGAKGTKLVRTITRGPRMLRLYRLGGLFGKEEPKKKSSKKKAVRKKKKK